MACWQEVSQSRREREEELKLNEELRHLARLQLSHERLPHALSATTLVHEAYLRVREMLRALVIRDQVRPLF